MTPKNTCAILARVSGKGQEDGYSLDSQLKLLRDYCERNNYVVLEEFRVVETASKAMQRKTFNRMLKFLTDENVYKLIVEKTDRFSRNFKDAVAIDEWMHGDEDRALHAVKENLIVHKNAKSDVKFMWNIHLAVAKKYTDNLREEVMKGWAEKLAQGWLPAPPPPGYMTILRDGKKIHVPDPKTASTMKKIFKLYLQPEHSVRSIGVEMHKRGITTRKNRPITKSNVYKILKNPFYVGRIHFADKDYIGAQEPLISDELFQAVQSKLENKSPNKKIQHDYALKGMMSCVYCDKTITWWRVKGHLYGACQRKLTDCKKKKFIREDKVQEEILLSLKALINPSPEVMEWVVDMLNSENEDKSDNFEDARKHHQMEIERFIRMDDMLYEDKLSGEISIDKYKEKHESFQSQIQALRKEISEFGAPTTEKHEEAISIIKLSQNAASIYMELEDVSEQRSILTKLFKSMVVHDTFISVTCTDFVNVITQKSIEMGDILKTLKIDNLTIKKGLSTEGKTDLLTLDPRLRSLWCG